jgi:G:T/U-mismatch repair DNA glycosylase
MRCYWEHVERKFWEHHGNLMGTTKAHPPQKKKKKKNKKLGLLSACWITSLRAKNFYTKNLY